MFCLNEYEQMRNAYRSFDNVCTELCSTFEVLKESAGHLHIPWEGEANRIYLLRLNADLLECDRVLQKMLQAKELLRVTIEEYQKTEGVISQMIGGMKL